MASKRHNRKTQLAIEYAYRRREADPNLWVFWVHASSSARFEESYRQIAQQVHIENWADPKTNVLKMVYVWLSNENNGHWAMIVDNADNEEVMFGSPSDETMLSNDRALSDYLPSPIHGSILITSRSRKVAEGLIEYAEDIIDVGPMMNEDAIVLLRKKLRRSRQAVGQDQLIRLVQELDFMPLAITQAAAYINQLAPRMTVSQYLDRLARSDLDRDALLQKDIRDPRRDGRASNSIIITWHTSFQHIRQVQLSAARLLALMCLFDRQGIPGNLLQDRYLQGEPQLDVEVGMNDSQREDRFNEDIATLQTYSLIKSGVNNHLFDMHRLVQFSTRKWLDLRGEMTYWQDTYISILDAEVPTDEYSNWQVCQALFPHVEAMMSYGLASQDCVLKRTSVLIRGGRYAQSKGQHEVAYKMLQISLRDRERLLGPDNLLTINCVLLLGGVLCDQGKHEMAEAMHRRALDGFEMRLGAHHRFTLNSAASLALVLSKQEKHEEAEWLCRRVLAGLEAEPEPDQTSILLSMRELSVNLQFQGKFDEAEHLCQRALAGLEEQHGSDNGYALDTAISLTHILCAQMKYNEAEQMNRHSLESCEKYLGPCHPKTLTTVHNRASILCAQRDYQNALQMSSRAVEGRVQNLGPSHTLTLLSLELRRVILRNMNKSVETLAITPST